MKDGQASELPRGQIYEQAWALLSRFTDPAQHGQRGGLLASLQPRESDYTQVFIGPAAERARAGYLRLWQSLPMLPLRPTHTVLRLALARAEELVRDSEASQSFPGGYREIAALLVPQRVWLCWEILEPGDSDGLLFDGLVFLGDHFAWFPKPWRVLAEPTL